MKGFVCVMVCNEKKINENYINILEERIADAYIEAIKQYLSSADVDLERFVQRYSGMRNALAPARHTMSRILRRKITLNDIAEFMDIDFDSLNQDESEMLKEEIISAINDPIETIGQDNFDDLLRGFLHI